MTPSYGRKGHLKAIWLRQQDGGNPIDTHPRAGTRYSFLQQLETGNRCWRLRQVDGRDEDGTIVTTREDFQQVLLDCVAR